MNPKEKADELMRKMNNFEITKELWYKSSDYAKRDLKRKTMIVVDEVINLLYVLELGSKFWEQVKIELEKYEP